jgi:hypothetical protein
VDREDVGMLEPGGEVDLPAEPLGAERRPRLGAENLEGDRPVVLQVVGEIDGRHPATAELPLDGIAPGEGVGELIHMPNVSRRPEGRHCCPEIWAEQGVNLLEFFF